MTSELPQEFVDNRVKRVRDFEKEHGEAIGRGRQLGWELQGHLFEVSCEIEDNPEALIHLQKCVDALAEKEKFKWLASDRTVFENMLVLTLGYKKTLSKRHYYNRAFEKAKAAGKRTWKEYADAVQAKEGLSGYIGHGTSGSTTAKDPTEILKSYAASLDFPAQTREVEEGAVDVVEREVHPDPGASGFVLLLVRRESDTASLVVREVTEPKVVASVITAITAPPTPKQLDRIKRLALWDLNRIVQMRTSLWRGKIQLKDLEEFKAAVESLEQYPTLFDEFFEGKPEVWIDNDHCDLHVQNADTNPIDPARFIKNAKPLSLIPFTLRKETPVKTKQEVEQLPGYTLWKNSPPRRRAASTGNDEEAK